MAQFWLCVGKLRLSLSSAYIRIIGVHIHVRVLVVEDQVWRFGLVLIFFSKSNLNLKNINFSEIEFGFVAWVHTLVWVQVRNSEVLFRIFVVGRVQCSTYSNRQVAFYTFLLLLERRTAIPFLHNVPTCLFSKCITFFFNKKKFRRCAYLGLSYMQPFYPPYT